MHYGMATEPKPRYFKIDALSSLKICLTLVLHGYRSKLVVFKAFFCTMASVLGLSPALEELKCKISSSFLLKNVFNPSFTGF